MTNDEIAGRLVALEVFSMTALGLYLANSRNDPDYSIATAFIDHLRAAISSNAAVLPPGAKSAAEQYADHLVKVLAENVRQLRGESGQSH